MRNTLRDLIEYLEKGLWNENEKVAQEIYKAVWWLRNLAHNSLNPERVEFLRRTVKHQLENVERIIARETFYFGEVSLGMIDQITSVLFHEWEPELRKSLRINSLHLMEDFEKDVVGANRWFFVQFFAKTSPDGSTKNSWRGIDQGYPDADLNCQGVVSCQSFRLEDGVGGSAFLVEPLAVTLCPEPMKDPENPTSREARQAAWVKELHDNWTKEGLFEDHDFVRHMGPGPAHGKLTTIASCRVK